MPLLTELGAAVRRRRQEMGLSQQQLAGLAELSRATITDLENGKLKDLSTKRIERLANELGFAVGLVGTRRATDSSALETAARVASVPYATQVPADVLAESLKEGVVSPGYIPHLRNLLEEAPVGLLANLADELHRAHDIPDADTWKRMRMLASVLKCQRRLWQDLST
ncbi:helix-turn-helix transcriptional regulator [Ramlibacter sp. USB13]|uniref:Helix-turn-helix transcriptional regulator n=1 Tax=Ramlibacter cellulosilyticus TaxID=2764187 RepID=A0A923S947_9BURK|nr:helix-turn-helix transcriptional regulator [Ramlibacter cellulosilyticus]MBC5781374.1 helix-turn-helix transcriptional regulator [Ramlibacter cellulosilyticus]